MTNRQTDTALHSLFLDRWSPRAYDKSVMPTEDLRTILDAGRWAQNTSVLLFIVSDKYMGRPDRPNHVHSFDAGAAWAMMALQAHMLGYHAHGMVGVDFDRAQAELGVPETFRIEAAVAIGRMGDPATLPDALRDREVPSDRKPLDQVAFAGNFVA
jgi:nitroreductase